MKTIKDLIGSEKGNKALVVGAGVTIKEYKKQIDDFISTTNPFIIGVNNMSNFWIPHYHVWTNNQRFRAFGKNIHNNSTILLGSNISLKVINNVIEDRDYVMLERVDREGVDIEYRDGIIYGYFRTAGCLSVMLAYLLGASEIYIAGMDGYTLYNVEDIISGKESQHCYGKGHTDTASWQTCVKKDRIIGDVLQNIQDYGINFKIITPTKYKKFYKSVW
jgi:hypothetical protein